MFGRSNWTKIFTGDVCGAKLLRGCQRRRKSNTNEIKMRKHMYIIYLYIFNKRIVLGQVLYFLQRRETPTTSTQAMKEILFNLISYTEKQVWSECTRCQCINKCIEGCV